MHPIAPKGQGKEERKKERKKERITVSSLLYIVSCEKTFTDSRAGCYHMKKCSIPQPTAANMTAMMTMYTQPMKKPLRWYI